MRLTVCTPTHSGDLHYSTVATLLRLQAWALTGDHAFSHLVMRSPWVAFARDRLAQQALDGGATHVLFLDADVGVSTPSFVERLVALGVDIAGALYFSKPVIGDGRSGQCEPPPFSSARVHPERGECRPLRPPQRGVVRDVLIGGGCMLVRRSVFERLPAPWFQFRESVVDGERRMFPEDWTFCEAALDAGMTTAVDCDIATDHYGACGWRHSA